MTDVTIDPRRASRPRQQVAHDPFMGPLRGLNACSSSNQEPYTLSYTLRWAVAESFDAPAVHRLAVYLEKLA
jgi:hypothetical protein